MVCFEYADKAPPEITGLFSQILEHGTLTDSRGKITDFSGATVVFTVSEQSESRPVSGFAGQDTKNNYVLPGHLTDKTDKTVEFDQLDNDSLIKIIDNRLKDIKKNCGAELTYTEDVCRVLLNKCGARNGRGALRAVEEYIEEPLSFVMLGDGICGVNIRVNGKDIDITGSKSLDKTAVLEYNQ